MADVDPNDLFAGLKKKSKSSKKNVNFDPTSDTLVVDSAAPTTTSDVSLADTAVPVQSDATATAIETAAGGKKTNAFGNDIEEIKAEVEAADPGDMFGDLKKKKKKKRDIPLDMDLDAAPAESSTPPAAESSAPSDLTADAVLAEFGDLKKKKKSKKGTKQFDLEAFEREIGEADSAPTAGGDDDEAPGDGDKPIELDGDLGDDVFGASGSGGAADADEEGYKEAWIGTERDYTYPELLGRFYHQLHLQNPELSGPQKKLTLVPPVVNREGTKKTVFANLADICKRMHRQPKHVMEFLFAELGTSGSVDGNQRLIIKGRYTQKSMENVLRRYIVEYVTCKTCKSSDTILDKENRLNFITCESCGSKRSVTTIKSGFQAQIGKRKLTKPE